VLKRLKLDGDHWLVLLESDPSREYIVAIVAPNGDMKSGIAYPSLEGAQIDFETRCLLSERTKLPVAC
jgi:hypothetical protein